MGGSQSQERVVTVEGNAGEDGDPQITVTQDFLQYIYEQGGGQEPEEREPPPYEGEQEEPYISAEDLLTGEPERSGQQREGDSKWKQRYERERRKNAELKDVTGREFDKAVTEVREKFSNTSLHSWVPVCEESKDRVVDCYRSNPGHALNCSSEAKKYMECVEKARKAFDTSAFAVQYCKQSKTEV